MQVLSRGPLRTAMLVTLTIVSQVCRSALSAGESTDAGSTKPPNVVLIISDDQAFTDFGFMGHEIVRTPHIDRLAEQSACFPNGYVPSSLCRPSLATLLTGLYPHQHMIHFNDPPDKANRQQAEYFIQRVSALPRLLGSAGYKSLQTGKFWEGNHKNAGFTEGMTHGVPNRRLDKRHATLGLLPGRHGDLGLTIGRDGLQPIYNFIEQQGDSPFFLWYAPFMPHTPFTPPEKYKRMYEGIGLHPRIVLYYAMCTWFDDTVGELMAYLDNKNLADNTLVLFVVDNGWITNPSGRPSYAPRSKRSPFEMGIRTPILIRWQGKTKAATHGDLVSSVDLVPTMLTAAGLKAKAKTLPGLNLLPLAEGNTDSLDRKAVFGDIYEHDASSLGRPERDLLYRWVRTGNWKLIDAKDPAEPDMLFDLAKDPKELTNLVIEPEFKSRRVELQRLLDGWWKPNG